MIHAPDGRPVVPAGYDRIQPLLLPDAGDRAAQLKAADAARYRRIFALQEAGEWTAADREIAGLGDRRLMGEVLSQRYLHPDRRAGYDELLEWLRLYGDQAGADRIYALALRRQPAGQKAPRAPRADRVERLNGSLERLAGYRPDPPAEADAELAPDPEATETEPGDAAAAEAGAEDVRVAPRSRTSSGPREDRAALAKLRAMLDAGRPADALGLLGKDEVGGRLDTVQYDSSRSRIAAGLYYSGKVQEALSLASASAARSGRTVTQAHWIAGLAAWRLKQYDRATRHFEALAAAGPKSPWLAAGASYWAARGYARRGLKDEARVHLSAAARFSHTFYGLIAERALGQPSRLRWRLPDLKPEHVAALAERPEGRRAIALLQVGRHENAERELLRVHPRGNPLVEEALLSLADRGGLSTLALQLGNAVLAPDGMPYDAALFPLPHWRPRDGFSVDRALVYGVMRQESRFDTRLISSAGATGLMQIMPATAEHVRERNADIDQADRGALFDPATNIEISQRYLNELLTMPSIGGNLFLLTAAYNAGPGNLQRWQRELSDVDDPLLFIESMPFAETRDYVEKVLANFWIYRLRLGQETASLDAVAADGWPVYMAVDAHPTEVAETAEPSDAQD